MLKTILLFTMWNQVLSVDGRGLLLLYRPRDISMDCAFSEHLRYDLSFGMGMSDTITLVFRTLSEVDYECGIEIASESNVNVYLLVVIRFPTTISFNCYYNPYAFTVLKKHDCYQLCKTIGERDINSPYFTMSAHARLRFRFVSNSSINSDMNANQYEVTATSARIRGDKSCDRINETSCMMGDNEYCFTSGVVCDGVKNCGVPDWFDERKSDCELYTERLGYNPVIALAAACLCAALAVIHIMSKMLPPLANLFFIFNINEDNRLCINPLLKVMEPHPLAVEKNVKRSIIPVSSSSSSESTVEEEERSSSSVHEKQADNLPKTSSPPKNVSTRRKNTMKAMTERIHKSLRAVAGRTKTVSNADLEENIQKTPPENI